MVGPGDFNAGRGHTEASEWVAHTLSEADECGGMFTPRPWPAGDRHWVG